MPLALPAYLFQLAALSAFLKSKAVAVRYEELVIEGAIREGHLIRVNKAIAEFKPDLIAFSSYEMSFAWIQEICDYIKSLSKEIPIIVGGYYPTLSPEDVLKHNSVDVICLGEGEYPLLELLSSLKNGQRRTDIANLWFKEGGRFIKNPLRPLLTNLDELPFVDRDLFTSENRKSGSLEVMASRGCPYDCTNCSNHALKKLYHGLGPYMRYRTAEHVLSEIEQCLARENFKSVQFEDDMFTSNPKWLEGFCRQYKERIKLPFSCNIRPGTCSPQAFALLRDAGCRQVSIGLESGDEIIRRNVLGRDMPDKVIIEAFGDAKKAGIKRKSFNMVGLPGETVFSLWKTIWLNLRLAPEAVQTSVYYPFKGTILGDRCYSEGLVDLESKKRLKLYAFDSILNLPGLPRWVIRIAKWLNSATVLRSGNITIFKPAFAMVFRSIYKKPCGCAGAN